MHQAVGWPATTAMTGSLPRRRVELALCLAIAASCAMEESTAQASRPFDEMRGGCAQYSLGQIQSDREIDDRPRRYTTQVMFDADSGVLRLVLLPSGQYPGNTISNWLYALHMANVFGLPYRIFVCGLGLVIVMLPVTGVYLWWKKRRSRFVAAGRCMAESRMQGGTNQTTISWRKRKIRQLEVTDRLVTSRGSLARTAPSRREFDSNRAPQARLQGNEHFETESVPFPPDEIGHP